MTVGLIGCGHWGQLILKTLTKLSIQVIVCDTNPDQCRQALALGALSATSFMPPLAAAEGLIVATPAATHRLVLEGMVALGKPIFVEKPLAVSYEDAVAIGRLDLPPTFLMHIWRYHPGIQLLRSIYLSGELGDTLLLKSSRTNWTSPRTDTDSLRTLIPHDLTIILHILGTIPLLKAALAERHNGQIRGLTALFGDKPGCVVDISTRYADKRREVRLHGTKGVAVLADEQTNVIAVWHGTDQAPGSDRLHEQRFFEATPPLQLELAAFLEYLRGGPAPISSLAEGIGIMRMIDEIDRHT